MTRFIPPPRSPLTSPPPPFPAPRPASSQEVREALRRRGIAISSAQLASVLAELDADGDERVSRAEFEAFARRRRAQIRDVFRGFDRDGDGRVTSEELRDGVERAGLKISDEQLRLVFRKIDRDGSGTLSEDEFARILLLLPEGANAAAAFDAFLHRSFVDDAEGEYTVPRDLPTHAENAAGLWDALAGKLASGGVAGAVSRTATAPIDRIKTIMQSGRLPAGTGTGTGTGTGKKTGTGTSTSATTFTAETAARARSNAAASSSRGASAPPTLRSAVAAVYREGGARAFWRGNGANVVKVVPETAVKFVAFDVLKHRVARDPGNATVSERFAAGGLAGAAAQAAIYPLEIVKTRMALSSGPNAGGIVATALAIARESGPAGLFRGLQPSLVGIFPYAGIDLMANSVLKDAVAERYQAAGREPGVLELLGCGMASSTTAMMCTYPLNVVRTRMQTSGMPGAPTYEGPAQCFFKILREEGGAGLYRGVVPSLAKVLPATSISYAVYDTLSKSRGE